MHKLAIYPFSPVSIPLCEFFPVFRPEYKVTDLVSPVGLGLAEHDAGHATNRSNLGITVHGDINKAIDECDALLVPFGDLKNDPAFRDAFAVMNNATRQRKTVFCAPRLTRSQYQKLHLTESSFHYGFQEKPYYSESGVYLYLMTQIVRPDYAIVCMPYTEFTGDEFQVISKELHAKFGCGIDLVHLSNKFVHTEQAHHTGKEQTLYLPEQEVAKKAKELREENVPVYCAMTHEEREFLYQELIKKLTVD